jgi:Copine/C2 domain
LLFLGTSDPFAVVTQLATNPNDKPRVLGQTEVIKNTLSPQWTALFKVEYELGTPVKLAVSVFGQEVKKTNKPMGSAILDVGELLGARGNTKAKKLKNGGTLFANVRPSQGSGTLRLQLRGMGLKNVEGMFSKSDPFFELSRQINSAGAATWDNVYRSLPVKNNLDPNWQDATLELSALCGGNLDQPILISVADFEGSGKHTPMGQCETTVNSLIMAAQNKTDLVLTNRKKQASGKIAVVKADVSGHEKQSSDVASVSQQMANVTVSPSITSRSPSGLPSFADYVSGGCTLNVTVAIDFTGSNGDPRKPGTLHYMDKNSKNDYEKAISAILGILQKFDDDQQYEVLGFGAKFQGVVRHCFQVGKTPTVSGIDGVLDAYNHVFESGLTLSAPTVFTDVVNHVASTSQQTMVRAQQKGGLAYSILLIVTDGAVSDVEATAQCLRLISTYPLSVVIVGVGNADFASMQFLDDNRANQGFRDLAQFVPFNLHSSSPADLTSETLKEIPRQLEECFHEKKYKAGDPIVVRDEDIVVEPEEEEEIDLSLDVGEEGDIVVSGGGTAYQRDF